MKSSSRITIAALYLLAGTAVFIVGRNSSPPSAANEGSAGMTETSAKEKNSRDGSHSQHTSRRKSGRSSISSDELATLTSIAQSVDPHTRNREMLAYIGRLGPDDFEAAVAHFRSLGSFEERQGEFTMLLSAWAKIDPFAALAYAKANDYANDTSGRFVSESMLNAWASRDPDAALRWAKANHQGGAANPYLVGIIRSIAETNPNRASKILTGMPRSVERAVALESVIPHFLSQGNDAALAWINSIDDERLRSAAMMSAVDKLAATDPAGTAELLMSNPSETAVSQIYNVYRTWAYQDQQAATNSLASLPSGEIRSNALHGLIASVASENPQDAVSLLNQFPNDVSDSTVQNLIAGALRGGELSLAASQIARIQDEEKRNSAYLSCLLKWSREDSSAANTWIRNNQVPPSVIKTVDSFLSMQGRGS